MRLLLESHYSVNIVGTSTDITEAMSKVIDAEPDILFIDIEMPTMSGLQFCSMIHNEVRPDMKVVFYTAPSVRATLGEAFGLPVGTNVEGRMITAIKQLGEVKCFNMDITADLTIMEEANELLSRLASGKPTPMFTSCCPGWIKFAEHYYPQYIPNLSTCKSPQEMFSALLKTYYCEKNGIKPENLFVVSVIPCTAKKFEVTRDELGHYTDAALTTRELAKMIKEAGIDFVNLGDGEYDNPFGEATGAGAIFGATGGVMEAALRTAAVKLGGKGAPLEFKEVRGTQGVKEAVYTCLLYTSDAADD